MVGFQLSKLALNSDQLERVEESDLVPEEFCSLMISGGTTCAIGYSDHVDYFVLHNISITDAECKQWYITMGITANGASRKAFEGLIQKIFLDYSGFLAAVPN